jgi:hypothetical protein
MDNVWSAGISNRFRSIVLTGNAKKGCARHMHRSDNRILTTHTDCGFDTSAGMGAVTADVVWAKIRSLRDGAKLATERLFGAKA